MSELRTADVMAHAVARHMTRAVVTVEASSSLGAAARLLATRRISGAVVVAHGRPIGVVTERDVVRAVATDRDRWSVHCVGATMSRPVKVIAATTTMAEAITMLVQERIRRLPVVSLTGHLVGILTHTDIVRAVHQALCEQATEEHGSVDDRHDDAAS